MKTKLLSILCIAIMVFSCDKENIEVQEDSSSSSELSAKKKQNKLADTNDKACVVIDADRSPFGAQQQAANFWWSKTEDGTDYFDRSTYFSQDANNKLNFTEYDDGTANIYGSTVYGTCVVDVDVWLIDKKSWDVWSSEGGEHKKEGTAGDASNSEDMRFYIIDDSRSIIMASGSDCVEEGMFGIEQRPDPEDENTPNFGAHIGPGGANYDSNIGAIGLSTWGWLFDKASGARMYLVDFNFLIECPEIPCQPCDGKVTELELQYNGDAPSTIEVKTKGKGKETGSSVFMGVVQPGGTFSFVGNDDKGTLGTEISVYVNGSLSQKIHTSCSQPIGPGAVFGDFLVVRGASRNGGELCPEETPPGDDCGECDGKVTKLELGYNSDEVANITVKTKKDGENGGKVVFDGTVMPGETFSFTGNDKKGTLGTEITIYVNGEKVEKIHTSCSVPIGPGAVFGDFTVVGGASRNGGELCETDYEDDDNDDDDDDDDGNEDCDCDGKLTELDLFYDGDSALITVKTKGKKGTVIFNANVDNGGTIELDGNDKHGTLGTEITIYVNGEKAEKIHTSCSDPNVVPGYIVGDFEVIRGASRNNGELCQTTNGG